MWHIMKLYISQLGLDFKLISLIWSPCICHGCDSNSDSANFSQLGGDANFSQLGGGADFSLYVTDVTVTVTMRTFPDLEAVPTFQL
jgi:hypothetical protein